MRGSSKNDKQASFVATATWIYGAPLSGLWPGFVRWQSNMTEVSFRYDLPVPFFPLYATFPRPRGCGWLGETRRL